MRNFLFRKIELWVVALLGLLGFLGLIVFGAAVRNVALGFDKFGAAGRVAYELASVPSTFREIGKAIREGPALQADNGDRFGTRTGWLFDRSDADAVPDGFLLLSRHDGDLERHVVELVDLQSGDVAFSWPIHAEQLLDGAPRDSNLIEHGNWTDERFRAIHPLPFDNGDLLIKDHQAPLMRINPCGGLVWRLDNDLYHHSSEVDENGDIWVMSHMEPAHDPVLPKEFFDDAIVKISQDGQILYERSITDILENNGFAPLLFSREVLAYDIVHSNDVQPVLKDGPYWKAGDVFISMRHISMVILYRPSTDKIVWSKMGPWAAQHDVDIVNDHTIAIFNNNMYNRKWRDERVDGVNDILFYDFATGQVSSPYKALFEEHDIRTVSEGLFTILPNGGLFVEEENSGRILFFAPDGQLGAEFINRASDGHVYALGWSRYLDRATGNRVLAAAQEASCPGN